jgi:hypothetical protein
VQQLDTADDVAVEQMWVVDSEGGTVLVAQGSASHSDLAFTADGAGQDAGDGTVPAAHAYDGHVPLVVDAQELAGVDATFDVLTSSPELFDVPVLDSPAPADDASAT